MTELGIRRLIAMYEGRGGFGVYAPVGTGLGHLRRFLRGHRNPVSMQLICEFVLEIKASKNWADSTKKRYISHVRGFAQWLVLTGTIEGTQADILRLNRACLMPPSYHLPKVPKIEEVEYTMKVARREVNKPLYLIGGRRRHVIAARNHALVASLYSTGCRIGELLPLRFKDIDLSDYSAVILGKGNKERVVYFSDEAMIAIERYRRERGADEDEAIFIRHDQMERAALPISATTAGNIVRKLSGGTLTPHSFRHNFATKVLRQTGNLALTQDLMGHASPETTRRYAVLMQDDLRRGHREVFHASL